MCTVVNKYKEQYDIYIGRGSIWGNPFPIIEGKQSREDVIEMYRKYLWKKINAGEITVGQILSLKGKKLGCFCKPKACHGDVLVKAVEWAEGLAK